MYDLIACLVVLAFVVVCAIAMKLRKPYSKFLIIAKNDDKYFSVRVKGWWGWKCAYVWTSYFAFDYTSKELAYKAIDGYVNRATEATTPH